MTTIEIARRMAQLGETDSALKAYALALNEDHTPAELLEAAAYTLDNGGDYKLAYTTFVGLYNAGAYREQIWPLMSKTFLQPNIRLLKSRYDRNVKLLSKYPYLFQKDFVPFEKLPLLFVPYDDQNGYVPFDTRSGEFRGFVNVRETVVSRNFFKDLEKPILASDVYSQYELEYLNDNVRPSEWVGRENHIYLHYTDWAEFCAWLTVLTMRPLVESKKVVFLIGDEIEQYPIDFKERFGVDYTQYPVKPIGIREVNKLIWHTQFSSSNGGDFFNEVFDAHPNLLTRMSIMFDSEQEAIHNIRKKIQSAKNLAEAQEIFAAWKRPSLVRDLFFLKNPSDKDLLVAFFLSDANKYNLLDPAARIAPALFFQPHFYNILFTITTDGNCAQIHSEELDAVRAAKMITGFKYIKSFTPVRRFTTAYGSTLRFMEPRAKGKNQSLPDLMTQRVLNRSYMRSRDDRLFRDAVVVRFEDGKLNPTATFSRLAAFLDIPYTETMTYCSANGVRDVQTEPGNAVGFDAATVYRKYEDWMNNSERCFMEYLLRDAYAYFNYSFEAYDGSPMDEERLRALIEDFTILDKKISETTITAPVHDKPISLEQAAKEEQTRGKLLLALKQKRDENRMEIAKALNRSLRFINKRGQPLEMIPMLQPDPDLLDQPLYH